MPDAELILARVRNGRPGFIKTGIPNEWFPDMEYPAGYYVYDPDAPRDETLSMGMGITIKDGFKRYGLFYRNLSGRNPAVPPHRNPADWEPVDETDPKDGAGREGGGFTLYLTRGDVELRPRFSTEAVVWTNQDS